MCSNSPRHSQLSGDGSAVRSSTGPYYSNVDYSDDDPHKSQASERGVDLLPDPRQAARSDADADTGAVPVPLRVTKKRRPTKPSADVSASDASVGSGDLAPGMTSTLRQGADAGGPPTYANLSYEADTPEDQRREKQRGGEAGKNGKRRKQRGAGEPDPIRDPVMRNMAAQQQQQLRVHIKAQPGTAVHITPSATPPTRPGQDQAPAYHARPQGAARPFSSGGESETEI